jgi:heme-degrading monooxygenase HmoA
MPALPWKSSATPDPNAEYLAMASSLPLRRLRATFRFFRFVRAIRQQLARSEGLIGYSLWAKPIAKRYWTLSVWRDEAALTAFMHASPHLEIMTKLRRDMNPTTFVRWTVRGSEAPVPWEDALLRLDGALERSGSSS